MSHLKVSNLTISLQSPCFSWLTNLCGGCLYPPLVLYPLLYPLGRSATPKGHGEMHASDNALGIITAEKSLKDPPGNWKHRSRDKRILLSGLPLPLLGELASSVSSRVANICFDIAEEVENNLTLAGIAEALAGSKEGLDGKDA